MSSLDNKEELIKLIKEWMSIDNEIREFNKQLRTSKQNLKKTTDNLMKTMKENEIDQFDVKGGKLMYSKTSVKKPITKKSLLSTLSKFYKGDISQALEMNNFIMSNREESVKETIRRSVVKSSD
jgi:hypothetical protein